MSEAGLVLKRAAKRYRVRQGLLRTPSNDVAVRCARELAMMLLKDKYGWTHQAIGELMGCSYKATQEAIYRARKMEQKEERNARGAKIRRLKPDELARAEELNTKQGLGVHAIAEEFGCGTRTLIRECQRAGIALKRGRPGVRPGSQAANRTGDPLGHAPIGAVPPGHPLYEVDRAAVRARRIKCRYVGGWRQSSLADVA